MRTTTASLILIAALILAGCTTTQPINCPTVTCPPCNNPTPTTQTLFVDFINVGQGDATLIKQGETEMLIDCGKKSAGPVVTTTLKSKNVGDLEYLLITHPDSDHIGGCIDVLNQYNVHTVITNGETADTQTYRDVKALLDTEQQIIATKGNTWSIGTATIKVLQSDNSLPERNENSITTKLTLGTIDFLFTGDCDNKCEELLLTKDINSDILKVAHHGSKYATKINFLQQVKPQIAIISVGTNSYGHPTREVIDRLSQEGIPTYRTDTDGDITIKTDGSSFEIIK